MSVEPLPSRVCELLATGRALADEEIANELEAVQQHVHQVCRRLGSRGLLVRERRPQGIVNRLVTGTDWRARLAIRLSDQPPGEPLSKDEVKRAVKARLEAHGYTVIVSRDGRRGIDMDANGPGGRILVQASGEEPFQENNVLTALGELVVRMRDPIARYALALPDNPGSRRLARGIPAAARGRLSLGFFFVCRDAGRLEVEEELPEEAPNSPRPAFEGSALTRAQRALAGAIRCAFEMHGYGPDSVGSAAKRAIATFEALLRERS